MKLGDDLNQNHKLCFALSYVLSRIVFELTLLSFCLSISLVTAALVSGHGGNSCNMVWQELGGRCWLKPAGDTDLPLGHLHCAVGDYLTLEGWKLYC